MTVSKGDAVTANSRVISDGVSVALNVAGNGVAVKAVLESNGKAALGAAGVSDLIAGVGVSVILINVG